jgi:Domain of unknown function (DUF4386)
MALRSMRIGERLQDPCTPNMRIGMGRDRGGLEGGRMTSIASSRVAGFTFLFYIVAGVAAMGMGGKEPATGLLTILTSLSALVLGVALYALTRAVDAELALLALACRFVEAVPGHDNAFFFAVGSTIFCWLFLRGRLIPASLGWLGVAASALLVILLPVQKAGLLGGNQGWAASVTWVQWLPMLVFEVTFALWLLFKGIVFPAPKAAA